MPDYNLSFSPSSSREVGSYKLLQLTPDLTSLIENAFNNGEDLSLTIKGDPNEDAVLCSAEKTYAMRSIGLSNTLLVVTPVPDECGSQLEDNDIVIRDQLKEIIELTLSVPKLHKLSRILKDRQYDEGLEEDDVDDSMKCYTLQDARKDVQASDAELRKALMDRRILIVNNELRPIAPSYLNTLLELMLNLLVSLSMQHTSASVEILSAALADGHEVSRAVSTQIMSWFGEIKHGKWKMDVDAVVREVGLGVLRNHRHDPIAKDSLLSQWRSLIGDKFEDIVSLKLLEGNYLESELFGSDLTILKYFPASALPIDPAARFSDLFITRSKWKGEEIAPFLSDIAVNSKERDKLLLKYCRTATEPQGVRYTARAQYNG